VLITLLWVAEIKYVYMYVYVIGSHEFRTPFSSRDVKEVLSICEPENDKETACAPNATAHVNAGFRVT